MKRYQFLQFLICPMLLFATQTYGQTQHQINTSLGVGQTALRDQSMSPLAYVGYGLACGLSYQRQTDSKTKFFQLSFSNLGISNSSGNSCSFTSFAFKNYSLYTIPKELNYHLALGWSNNNFLNYYQNHKYGNFSERSNYFTTFGFAALLAKRFTLLNRGFIVEIPTDIQLLGFYLRPSYVSNSPEGYLNPENSGFEGWYRSIEAFLPHHSWNLSINPRISFFFKSGNSVSLAYQYEFLRINNPEPISQSNGFWHVSISTLL